MKFKDILYALTCLSFAVIIGAAIYEHCAVVPRWTLAPPASLAMFQGQYGLNAQAFWKPIHPVTLLLFVASMVGFWRSERRFHLVLAFVGYAIVLLITGLYFVPELIAITTTPYSDIVSDDLTQRAGMWETLSLLRLTFLIFLSLILFAGLTKGNHNNH